MKKTRAIQALESAGVAFRSHVFDVEGFVSGVDAARELRIPPDSLFKTLVVRGERMGVALAMVPSDETLSLRKLAQQMGDKRAEMVEAEELPRLTGYIKGGVSPLGTRRPYPVFMDQTAMSHSEITVSAGMRGLMIALAPGDLAKVARATVADLLE